MYPVIRITNQHQSLGRSGDIVIQNSYVSGKHLDVWRAGNNVSPGTESVFVQDLGSTNGTYINGRKLNPNEQVPISESDRIILGSEDVVYRLQKS